jgi:hypothetical protein
VPGGNRRSGSPRRRLWEQYVESALDRGRPYAWAVRNGAPIVEQEFDYERSCPLITSFWLWQGIWKR